jgi:thymidylate synthase (FAD)
MRQLLPLLHKARKGVFIVIEGPDGSGKGYQTRALARWLRKKYPNRRVLLTHEPWEGERYGRLIRRALDGDRRYIDPADSERFQHLYVMNRIEHQMRLILDVLAEGGIVVCDRERLSTFAYGYAYNVSEKLIQNGTVRYTLLLTCSSISTLKQRHVLNVSLGEMRTPIISTALIRCPVLLIPTLILSQTYVLGHQSLWLITRRAKWRYVPTSESTRLQQSTASIYLKEGEIKMAGKASGVNYDRKAGSMNVELLYHTPKPELAIAAAARLCYAPVGASELMGEMNGEQVRKVLKTIMVSGHFSALEHVSYTFAIDGVSRAMTHQLVRHRLASYNQQSQRYVEYADDPVFVVPPSVLDAGDITVDQFLASCSRDFENYLSLKESGILAEDARYLLPNAMETKIVVTMNVRELLHFFELRCCKRAQWEIRGAADWMLELTIPTAPYIFMDAGASCRRGTCKEGQMTCGEPFSRGPRRE